MRIGSSTVDKNGNETLKFVYAPSEPTGYGNDAYSKNNAITEWSTVANETSTKNATYSHIYEKIGYKKCLPWGTSLRGAGSPVKIIICITDKKSMCKIGRINSNPCPLGFETKLYGIAGYQYYIQKSFFSNIDNRILYGFQEF